VAHLPVPAEAAEPGFLLVNNVLTITFGPDTWVIDAPLFGPSARVLHDRVGQAHRVRLQEARFQGTRIEANFEAHIQPRGPDWYIAVKFSNQPPQEFLLSRWMHGDAAVHWHITDPISLTTVTWLEIPSGGGRIHTRQDPRTPTPFTADGVDRFFFDAFSVEGYLHRTMYGRDAYVQVVSKGFYLPHGHRVATIKVTERQFRPHRDNPA
jgi:hypothetical protein